jgi:hypothetical protein
VGTRMTAAAPQSVVACCSIRLLAKTACWDTDSKQNLYRREQQAQQHSST